MTRSKSEIVIDNPYQPHALSLTKGHVQVEYRTASGLAALIGRRIWVRIPRSLLAQCLRLIEVPDGLSGPKEQLARWLENWSSPEWQAAEKARLVTSQADAERLLGRASAEERVMFMNKVISADPVRAREIIREITGKV